MSIKLISICYLAFTAIAILANYFVPIQYLTIIISLAAFIVIALGMFFAVKNANDQEKNKEK